MHVFYCCQRAKLGLNQVGWVLFVDPVCGVFDHGYLTEVAYVACAYNFSVYRLLDACLCGELSWLN